MNCVFHLKYIILQHIIQKYPLPQTKKDTEKKCNIFLLKNHFFYEGLLQGADWEKVPSFLPFYKYVSANSHKSVRYCNPVWYYILGK